jgi:ubiquinone/menaquinone biosynthesis C-methylase UbiE
MTVRTDMKAYYELRAQGYDEIYAIPERQGELDHLHARLLALFSGQDVLELACGTGYWTMDLAAVAKSVMATDISSVMLDIAKTKSGHHHNLAFSLRDAFSPDIAPNMDGTYTACFAGFWWSHVGREKQDSVLAILKKILAPQGMLVLIDNLYVENVSVPIARTDQEKNTYQIRHLPTGERYEVMKNFPTDSTLRKKFGSHLNDIRIERSTHYWMLTGRFK